MVTGATGFVGREVCRTLQQRGIAFRPVSRRPHPDCIAMGEMTAQTDWSAVLSGVTCVIHLAARVHVMQEHEADPDGAFRRVNVDATLNLARQAHEAGLRRFVFISSIKVNGEATDEGRPFRADDRPAPEDAYARSKAEAEAALLELGARSGLEIVIIRPPLVYGPGVRANFRLLMRWAGSGLPSIFGACSNRRSLVHVGNLADLVVTAATHPGLRNEVFLVSDGEDLTTRDLFTQLAKLQGRRGWNLPLPVSMLQGLAALLAKTSVTDRLLRNLEVDIAKTTEILGWTPTLSVRQGLQQTIDEDTERGSSPARRR
nr:NAD-dependent epimerase/dehydratase family protein [Rhizobium sp. SSA_523]